MKVLIADDDDISRKMLSAYLSSWGYEVEECSDGDTALALIRSREFPLAILDWMMPGKSGDSICEIIRSEKDKDYVYIILLTAKEGMEDLIKGLNAGADDYIRKPYNALELRSRLIAGERVIKLQKSLSRKIQELNILNKKLISAYQEIRIIKDKISCKTRISNLPYFIIDLQSVILGASAQFLEIIGTTRNKILSTPVSSIIEKSDLNRLETSLKEARIGNAHLSDVHLLTLSKKWKTSFEIIRLDTSEGMWFLIIAIEH